MPIVNGDYEKLSEAQIRDALETELQNEFGEDIDLTESSVFTTLTKVLATTLSQNQEESLQEVYRSAFLETATGIDLEQVVAIIGLTRRSAVHATGVQRFISDHPVSQDYTIQAGTVVQTDSDNPREFETSTTATLEYVTGFENQDFTDLNGDTGGDFTFNTSDPYNGAAALEAGPTSGDHVWHDTTLSEGVEYRLRLQTGSGGVPTATFGVQDANNYYQIALDEPSGEIRIEKVEGGSVTQTIDSNAGLTIPTDTYLDLELDWRIDGQMLVEVRDDNEGAQSEDDAAVVGTVGGSDSAGDDRWKTGNVGYKSGDATATKQFDESTTAAASANIRAVQGGKGGNLGSATLTVLPSPPSGVDSTTNLFPTGNTNFEDLGGVTFIIGRDEETDEELRERAQEAVSSGGDATHDAIVNTLINDVTGVSSVTVYENKTDTDNTGSGGLPPHSFEAVVFGGDDQAVAEAIFEKKAVTSRDYGGANGTAVSETVIADSNGQNFTIDFSRPTALDIDFSMDLVVDDTYIGDAELRNLIVEYVGGTLSDGTEALGLGVSEDVRLDALTDIIVGDDTGVIGFDNNASGDDITTTPSATTDSNGLDIVDVGANEVAQTDATGGSITINTTEI
jgi:uncharacterized phage protein gp47/JayE